MENLKHVGQVRSSGRRCLVAYRTLPGDAFKCLIIPTESLPDSYHDALMKLVESNAAQNAFEFYEVLNRSTFPDGSTMLVSLHSKGFLISHPTDDIEMIPNSHNSIKLSELNSIIAQQRGVSVQDLAILPEAKDPNMTEVGSINNIPSPKVEEEIVQLSREQPLSDELLALKFRQDAARLAKEVQALLEQAEQLDPSTLKDDTTMQNQLTISSITLTDDNITDVKKVPAKKAPAKKVSTK